MTKTPPHSDEEILNGRVDGFESGAVVLEHGKEHNLALSLFMLGAGGLLLVLGTVFYLRAKKAKAEEAAQIAEFDRQMLAWQQSQQPLRPGVNPYLRR